MRGLFLLITLFVATCAQSTASLNILSGYIEGENITEPIFYTGGELPISGEGIYRYTTTFDSLSQFSSPTLYFGSMYYPCKVYLNNTKLYEWGTLDQTGGMVNYRAAKITLPPSLLHAENRLTIEFWSDGLTMGLAKLCINEAQRVSRRVELHNARNATGIQLGVLLAFIVATIALVASLYRNREWKSTRYLAFFALSTGLTFHIFLFNSSSYDHLFQTKLFRTATLFMSYTLFITVTELSHRFNSRTIQRVIGVVIVLLSLIIWQGESKFEIEQFISAVIPFSVAPLTLFSLIVSFYTLTKERSGTWIIITLNIITLFVASINDLSSLKQQVLPWIWLIPYSNILTTATLAAILVHRQIKISREKEKIKKELELSSEVLEMTNRDLEEAKDAIEAESNARESFIKSVAHELRTPLSGLLGSVDIIATDEYVPKHLKKPLFHMQSSFHRLFVTVSNLFDFVEMKKEKLSTISHPFVINDVLTPLIQFYKSEALSRGISLIALPSQNFPKELYGDSEHLIQIIDNLLGNAIKFTANGGVSIQGFYEKGTLKFIIKDTGSGIKEEMQEALFKAFSRGEEFSFSQQYEGIGLGLAIVDSTIRAMKGTISFNSTVGKGTEFTFELPMLTVHKQSRSFKSTKRILVVDDNVVNCLMLEKQLEKAKFHVEVVNNGLEAVNICREKKFDLVLMDIQMPVMDGLTATQEIRKFSSKLPIIAVTANGDNSECLAAGMNKTVMKPVSTEKLISIMGEYLLRSER
jgi:signal transduction histidine kinase